MSHKEEELSCTQNTEDKALKAAYIPVMNHWITHQFIGQFLLENLLVMNIDRGIDKVASGLREEEKHRLL